MPQTSAAAGAAEAEDEGRAAHPERTVRAAEVDPAAAAQGGSGSLEDRYGAGRRRRFDRRFAWTAAGLLVLGGVGFLAFSGWQDANRVSWQDIGYTKTDELNLEVKFEVTGPANTPIACAVEALNTVKATVGWKVVELPVTEARTHTVTTPLVTTNPATATTVRTCWVIER
ncbi:DUF4307 domain-containing protein [Leucobacter massiliensis]|uniref:DUF4307 domain-containing protein n=1 Tax=Leucobacter massiliensis TaxID=1686285 RepID=UPI001FEA594A|nr:DUF4307 domain-containing protein [Leucobacter massiliensis]